MSRAPEWCRDLGPNLSEIAGAGNRLSRMGLHETGDNRLSRLSGRIVGSIR